MKEFKIKVLKDTPFDKTGTELSVSDFRVKYSYVCTKETSDDELITYLKKEKNLQDVYYSNNATGSWFQVIEIPVNNFKISDWVWHESLKRAFVVMPHTIGKSWRPNYVSFEAANKYTDIYKRKATQEEINHYNLVSYCDGDVLIGNSDCYYYNNTWKVLIGVTKVVVNYIQTTKTILGISYLKQSTSDIEHSFKCQPNGLKVGCKLITHQEIIQIAKQLHLI